MIRAMFFPSAAVVADTTIDFAKGPSAWPKNPVVYGGPHVNALLAGIGPQLPFKMGAGSLQLGLDDMKATDLALVTVVPARAPDETGPGYPSFLLYAGTGTPGVGEINALTKGGDALFVADAFGPFIIGDWIDGGGGRAKPRFKIAHEREELEHGDPKSFSGELAGKVRRAKVDFVSFGKDEGASDPAYKDAVMRGLDAAVRKLSIDEPSDMLVYLYPDREKKGHLTRKKADGHAAPYARVLHMVRFDPKPGGALERLAAHEGTHVLATDGWGAPGSALWGEGLAVWVAGGYQGVPLDAWKTRLTKRAPVGTLLGKAFFTLPEQETYPQSGLLVAAAIKEVGLEKARDHLYGATALDWVDACKRAGTTAEKLQAAVE